jgi:hypothetical protein
MLRSRVTLLAITAVAVSCSGPAQTGQAGSCLSRGSAALGPRDVEISARMVPVCDLVTERTGVVLAVDARGGSNDVRPPVRRTSAGDYLARGTIGDEFSVWSADGTFLRTVGRRGAGPGEFGTVSALYVEGDTIHVSDSPGKWHIYDANLTYVRSVPLNIQAWESAAFLDSGELLLGAGVPGGSDHLFNVFDRTGRLIRSFGPRSSARDVRLIGYHSGPSFWAVHRTRYVLENWSIDGTLLRQVRRVASWFPESDLGSHWSPASDQTAVLNVAVDSEGRPWVTTVRLQIGNEGSIGRGVWTLEIFDPSGHELLVSETYNDAPSDLILGLLGPGIAYRGIALDDDMTSAEIVGYRLAARAGK